MEIIPVVSKQDEQLFLSVPLIIYKNDPHWIRPLNKDIEDVFNPKRNKAFRFGKTQRWILKKDNCLIGRIAAFVNSKYKNKEDDIPVGGIGFFECINNQDAADLLFDNARHWLLKEGMEAMDGPINFGERDRWWGLLTEGFYEPLYAMNYHLPYYKQLFENYGFKPFYHQICLSMAPKEPLNPKIWERHAELSKNPALHSQRMRKNNLNKYARDFSTVYNAAWAGHGGLKQLTEAQAISMFNKMKPVLDDRILWLVYEQDKPVAVFLNLPDINQWFKYLNGKFGLLQKIKFLWLKRFKENKRFVGLVFGVVPEWQGKGMDNYIIGEACSIIQSDASPYTEYEMQWIGDFNPKMLNVGYGLGNVKKSRELTTYRYLFNRTKPFKRHPILA